MDSHECSPGVLDISVVNYGHFNDIQILQSKIKKAKERIQEEQKRRDENVEEYLKMAAGAQRNQLPHVKAVFEKRNVKAATHITALQRKLERYQKELKDLQSDPSAFAVVTKTISPSKSPKGASSPKGGTLEYASGNIPTHQRMGSEASNGSSNTSSNKVNKNRLQSVGHGIKSVSGNLKDGSPATSGSGSAMTKRIYRHKFGSADNVATGQSGGHDTSKEYHHGSANLPSDTGHSLNVSNHHHGPSEDDPSEHSESARSSSYGHDRAMTSINASDSTAGQLHEIKECLKSMREELEAFKTQVTEESRFYCQGLQEERFRAERLEEQVNDLTELHQAETGNLKQALADAEEKLSYQSEERLRDLAELLDACHAKISRLEQQQQQLVTIEGIENSTARALAVKLVNVGLTMLQLLLLLVATVTSALAPFLGSRIRLFGSLVIGITAFIVHRKWPEAQDYITNYWSDLLNRL